MNNSKRPTISIIIRTKNEEKWIGYCLDAVFSQIRLGNTLLRKVSDEEKNTQKHFSKNR